MKTAEEVYTQWFGSINYATRRSPSKANIISAMKEYAQEVAREALKNASENCARHFYEQGYSFDFLDQQSILNENNIPDI